MKTAFLMLLITIFSISGIMTVNAATISDDGKYTLVLNVMDVMGDIDGEGAKIIKFNVSEGETTVSLSELTAGIIPFNGQYEFSHWGKNPMDDVKADEELNIADFTSNGSVWIGSNQEVSYTNGLNLYAKFSDKALKGTGTYYLTLDPFAGTINGKANLRLTSKSSEFQTVDLTNYTPVREGYTFRGWDLDGKYVTSIDSSAFADSDAVKVTATYTQDTFIGDERVLVLDANGGTIDGKATNKYDYLAGADSGTSMSLLPYVPVREGYTFTGWNAKSDGSGGNYKYIYWRLWDKDNSEEAGMNADTILDYGDGYKIYQNLTLYAAWTKNADTPAEPDGHQYGDWTTTKAATCMGKGEKQRTCSCGEKETREIPALGHTYSTKWTTDKAATCKATGSKSHHCTRCGAKKNITTIPKTAHKYSWKTIKKATSKVNGRQQGKCSVCGKTTTREIISLARTKISVSNKTYTGKQIKPAVTVTYGKTKLKANTDYTITYGTNKATGKGTVTITGKGKYVGKVTKTFKIIPRKTAVSLKSSSRGKMTVSYTKKSEAVKYKIQYADNSKFKKAATKTVSAKTTKLTVSGKSGKYYYVRVSVIGKDGTDSGWSTVKKIKVK